LLSIAFSVLTFASAIVRVLAGLDTTTRPARPATTVAIAQVFPVASNATSSAGPSCSANARTPSHHPTDVVGGALLGTATALAVVPILTPPAGTRPLETEPKPRRSC
jgi:hypothetical protein